MPPIRCSSLDRAFACNLSLLPIDNPYDPGSQDATDGTAKHEALAYLPRGLEPPVDDIAAAHGVDREDIWKAVSAGRRALRDLAPYLRLGESKVLVEQQLEAPGVRGTGDLIVLRYEAEVLTDLIVTDWKTGWGRDLHPKQLAGYALCAVERFGWPSSGYVTLFEIWTAHWSTTTANLDRPALGAFASELAKLHARVAAHPGKLRARPGTHCKFCPRRVDCPARDKWLRESVTALAEIDPRAAMTPTVIGSVYYQVQEVKRTIALYEKVLKASLEDGPVPLPDGRQVALVGQEREKIDSGLAVTALIEAGYIRDARELLTPDLPKSRIEKVAFLATEEGGKARRVREMNAVLDGAGAVREEIEFKKQIVDGEVVL